MKAIIVTLFVSLCCLVSMADEFKESRKAAALHREYQAEVAKVEKARAKEIDMLTRDFRANLEKIQDVETKAGNLDAAVEIRDYLAKPPAAATPSGKFPIVGRYSFVASNKAYMEYTFSEDATVGVHVWSDVESIMSGKVIPSDEPKRKTTAAWQRVGSTVVVYVFDPKQPNVQRIEFHKDGKITGLHWSKVSQLTLQGRRLR